MMSKRHEGRVRQVGIWLSLCALSIAPSGVAAANAGTYQGSFVQNGGTVDDDLAHTNKLRIGTSIACINPNNCAAAPPPAGALDVDVSTSTDITFAATTACPVSTALVKNTAYYVYFEDVDLAGTTGLIFTTVWPLEDGNPSAGPLFYPVSGVCNTGTAAVNLLFLGSFITDANANVIPFLRSGQDVLFVNACSTSSVPFSAGPDAGGVVLDGCAGAVTLPTSASALILGANVNNTDTKPHVVTIVDANAGSMATCATLTAPILQFLAAPSTVAGQFQFDYETNIAGGANLTFGVCDPAWGTGSVTTTFYERGYVEPVHHLNQPR
jgi:hypothetical protein